jgi:HSP20 family protein
MTMDRRSMWDPWQEMRRLQQEMEHLFSTASPSRRGPLSGEYPPLNITRGDKGITLHALCPGVDRASLDVSVVGETLTIRGERKAEAGVNEESYHRRERPLGAFSRTIGFGERLDPDQTRATYTSGILEVQLARAPETAPKKIAIQS